MGDYYQTENEIEAVVQGFESCATGKDGFSHHAHLTVAVWYLWNSTPEQALTKMREGLLRFLDHHKVGREVYDETLTAAWVKLLNDVIARSEPSLSLLEVTNISLERYSNSRITVNDDGEISLRDVAAEQLSSKPANELHLS